MPRPLAVLLMTSMLQACATTESGDPLARINASLPGEVGLFAKHLGTNETLALNADAQQDRLMIPRRLPAGVRVGNKTGTDQEKQPDASGERGHIRNDTAIVETPSGVYVLAIFTRRVRDRSWGPDHAALVTGADLSRAVHDHLTRPE